MIRISQFTGSSLPYAPRSRTPPGPPSPRPKFTGDGVAAFRRNKALGSWKKTFSTLIVAARMPVHLRINTPVTRNAARLTYGLPG